jgi:hypothetical protein
MKDPANGIVDGFRLGKGLMAALMCNDPQSRGEQSGKETI